MRAAGRPINYPKLWSIGALHSAQSFPGALAAVALPALFRHNGLSLDMFWVFALPLIPGWLRWLMAIWVDNYGNASFGRRKSWIAPCTLVGAVLYLCLAAVPPDNQMLFVIVAVLCLKSTVMTAQDVAVDGLAADSLLPHERTTGSAIIVLLMFAGTLAGQMMVAGIESFGWSTMLCSAAALMVAAALPALLRPEQPPAQLSEPAARHRASVVEFLSRPESPAVLLTLVSNGCSSNFLRALFVVFLVDMGLSMGDISIAFGVSVVVGACASSAATPWLTGRFGERRVVFGLLAAYPVCAAASLTMAQTDVTLMVSTLMLTLIMYISSTVWMLLLAARYRWVDQRQSATDFSAQASVANFGEWLGASVAGFVAASVGWAWFFIVGWALCAASLMIFATAARRIDRAIATRNGDPATRFAASPTPA